MMNAEIRKVLAYICTQKTDKTKLFKHQVKQIEEGREIYNKYEEKQQGVLKDAFLDALKKQDKIIAVCLLETYGFVKLREVATRYNLKEHQIQKKKSSFLIDFYKSLQKVQK